MPRACGRPAQFYSHNILINYFYSVLGGELVNYRWSQGKSREKEHLIPENLFPALVTYCHPKAEATEITISSFLH